MQIDWTAATADENTFADSVAKGALATFFLAAAVQAPLVVISQLAGVRFSTYAVIAAVASTLAIAAWFLTGRRSPRAGDFRVTALLLMLGAFCAVTAVCTNKTDTDDYYYLPNVVHFLEHPQEPMDFAIHFFRADGGKTVFSPSQGTSMPYDYARGVVSRWLGRDFLSVYYFDSVAAAAFLIPLAYFLLFRRLRSGEWEAIAGAAVAVAALLVTIEQHRSIGSTAFPRMYHGKAVVLSLGLPAYAAFSLEFLARPRVRAFVLAAAVVAAGVGMNTSACLLFGGAAVCIAAAYLAADPHALLDRSRRAATALRIAAYGATLTYAFLFAAFLLLQIRVLGAANDPFAVGFKATTFGDNLLLLTARRQPVSAVLFAISVCVVAWRAAPWLRRFAVGWIVAATVVFLNPLSFQLLLDRVVPRAIYWRLFFLYPLPLMAGLAVLILVRRRDLIVLVGVLALCLGAGRYAHYFRSRSQFGRPAYKLAATPLQSARAIAGVSPAGLMLAPPRVQGYIPIVHADHPQLSIRADGNEFWLTPQERAEREAAAGFAAGRTDGEAEFIRFLRGGLASTVVLSLDKRSAPELSRLAQSAGYARSARAGGYLVVWK